MLLLASLLPLALAAPSLDWTSPEGRQQVVLTPTHETAAPDDLGVLHDCPSLSPVPVGALLAQNTPDEIMRACAPTHDEPRLLEVLADRGKLDIWGQSALGPRWATEGAKLGLRQGRGKFIDLTGWEDELGEAGEGVEADRLRERYEVVQGERPMRADNYTWPELAHTKVTSRLADLVDTDEMESNLRTFTSNYNRYYKSSNGLHSAEWLKAQIDDIVANTSHPHLNISTRFFAHSFAQPSIIARIEPNLHAAAAAPLAPAILGAHQDSANYLLPLLRAPGADDDGSGSVTILEAFRVLVSSDWGLALPNASETELSLGRPVEFHWYAAEEGGLLGSQDIVRSFVREGRDVAAMVQCDMTGYLKNGVTPRITAITSDTTVSLTKWLVGLAEETKTDAVGVWGRDLMPNAGSDHMSWYRAGYPSVFLSEADPLEASDPYIHGTRDIIDLDKMPNSEGVLSFDHMAEFSRVAIGWAVELGAWVPK